MSIFTEKTSKKIDMIFVFALITVFAATSFILVLIGAKQYRSITNTMDKNYEVRTASSYLAEKVRQHDYAGAISITDLEGTSALAITSTEDDISFITYIYYYENALREIVVTGDSVFSLSSGQKILEMQDFDVKMVNESLIRAEVTNNHGETEILYLNIHCDADKEVL